jgi:hypothetical protein
MVKQPCSPALRTIVLCAKMGDSLKAEMKTRRREGAVPDLQQLTSAFALSLGQLLAMAGVMAVRRPKRSEARGGYVSVGRAMHGRIWERFELQSDYHTSRTKTTEVSECAAAACECWPASPPVQPRRNNQRAILGTTWASVCAEML